MRWFQYGWRSVVSTFCVLVLLTLTVPAAAQGDDCALCPLGESIWNGLVDGFKGLFDEGTVAPATEPVAPVVLPPIPEGTPDPTVPEDTTPIGTNLIHSVSNSAESDQIPKIDDKCDPANLNNLNLNSCGVATASIIWPEDCGNAVQNERILAALTTRVTADRVFTSTNKCGTFFFTAPLTQDDIDNLLKENIGIKTIEPDSGGSLASFSTIHKMRNQKRDTVEVMLQSEDDLAYISTPPNSKNLERKYARFARSGAGITIYIVDTGAVANLPDFTSRNLIEGWIYGLCVINSETDLDPGGHGTCMLAKVAVAWCGVAVNPKIIVVKIDVELRSTTLDGLEKINRHMEERHAAGKNVKGFSVVLIALCYPKQILHQESELRAKNLMRQMVTDWQVVFVVASCNAEYHNGDKPYDAVNRWPASFAQTPDLPIIVVGAVDTDTTEVFEWSMGSRGGGATVHAPGRGRCLSDSGAPTTAFGTSVAAAITCGYIGDLLSRDVTGPMLRRDENSIARNVRDYVVSKAYIRDPAGGEKVVWNGLYPDEPGRESILRR